MAKLTNAQKESISRLESQKTLALPEGNKSLADKIQKVIDRISRSGQ